MGIFPGRIRYITCFRKKIPAFECVAENVAKLAPTNSVEKPLAFLDILVCVGELSPTVGTVLSAAALDDVNMEL